MTTTTQDAAPDPGTENAPGTHPTRSLRLRQWERLRGFLPIDKAGTNDLDLQNAMHMACLNAGVRVLPHPFDAALGLASDIDLTDRASFYLCTRQLVGEHGLDYGDSIWLHRSEDVIGQAFFDPWFRRVDYERIAVPPQVLGRTQQGRADREAAVPAMDLHEIARAHHLGSIDHWHSFLTRGPRAVPLSDLARSGEGAWEARRRDDRSACGTGDWKQPIWQNQAVLFATFSEEMAINALSVTTDAAGPGVSRASLRTWDGTVVAELRELPDPPRSFDENRRVQLFEIAGAPDGSGEALVLASIGSAMLETGGTVLAACLHNAHTGFILDRLAWLRDELDLSLNLSTCHAGFHFYAGHRVNDDSEKVLARRTEHPEVDEALFGQVDTGTLAFSTVADDPKSFARVYPDIATRHGVRYLNPHGAELDRNLLFTPFTMTYPCRTKAGGAEHGTGLHFVRRVMPDLPENHGITDEQVSRRTAAATFEMRLGTLLERFDASETDLCNLFYTHLGNRIGCEGPPSEPYFPVDDSIIDLKRRHFGIGEETGVGTSRKRVWFSRASVLCDYTLMIQTLPSAVTRPDADTIRIRSWDDPVFGTRLPEWAGQAFGVTFYCDNPTEARVTLDGEPVEDLALNPADTTFGRPSVTVTACGIRHPLVWWKKPETETRDGVWSWKQSRGAGVGTLKAKGKGWARARLTVQPRDVDGSQVLSWWQRTSDGANAALVLETDTGGRFGFGDPAALEAVERDQGALTARAPMMRPPVSASRGDGWRRMSCPLWSLEWPRETDPRSTPMPSHRPVAVELWVGSDKTGLRRASAKIAEIELGRPRTTRSRREPDGTIVLGGRLASGAEDEPLELVDERSGAVTRTVSEADGRFRFTRAQPGPYRLRYPSSRLARTSGRQGPETAFEALTSMFDLTLDPH